MVVSKFTSWLKAHGCSKKELWLIQNCIGTVFGFDHLIAKEATEAWSNFHVNPGDVHENRDGSDNGSGQINPVPSERKDIT